MAVGALSLLTGLLLARADQSLFGLPSELLAALSGAVGLTVLIRGLAEALRSRPELSR